MSLFQEVNRELHRGPTLTEILASWREGPMLRILSNLKIGCLIQHQSYNTIPMLLFTLYFSSFFGYLLKMIKLWVVMIFFCLCSSTGFGGGEGVVRPMAMPVPDVTV